MPGRSPLRRTPPPPLITRRSPDRSRVRSPRRQPIEMASSSRGRERREYRPTIRRSRSPIPTKRRSFSPPMKRKASPIAEREMTRRTKISKSPVVSRGAPEGRYHSSSVQPDARAIRSVTSAEKFRDRECEDREGGVPQFRGPEGSVDYDLVELKKFTIEIVRKPSGSHGETTINRSIINPENIAPVRRPDVYERDYHYYNNGREKDEGSMPLFLRAETIASRSRSSNQNDDYQRIVAIDNSRGSGNDRGQSRERPPQRYSPAPGPSHYEDTHSRRPYFNERERGHSPYEARHRSPHRDEYVEKHRERLGHSREEVKREFVVRKKEERRYSPERRLSYERDQRESDLRSRINEKRSDPHSRVEERERERRYEVERERGDRSVRPHHSSPPRERRRPASLERHEGSRDRREAYERDREREGRERDSRRHHSREREPRDHSDSHYEDSRRPTSHKGDYEPKKFYKTYEPKEFVPPPVRGRGVPIRRGVPPIMRGRGIPRGMGLNFRGVMVPRGMPRGRPFIPRGFPPRFFPPY